MDWCICCFLRPIILSALAFVAHLVKILIKRFPWKAVEAIFFTLQFSERDAQTIWAEVAKKTRSCCDFECTRRMQGSIPSSSVPRRTRASNRSIYLLSQGPLLNATMKSPEAPLSCCLITQVQRNTEAAACWDFQKTTSQSASECSTCGPVEHQQGWHCPLYE